MGPMSALESTLPQGRTGGQAPVLPVEFMPNAPREVRYLRWALDDVLRDCGLMGEFQSGFRVPRSAFRVGVVLGTTLHGIRQGGVYLRTGDARPMEHFLA